MSYRKLLISREFGGVTLTPIGAVTLEERERRQEGTEVIACVSEVGTASYKLARNL